MQVAEVAAAGPNTFDIREVSIFDIFVADRGRKEMGDVAELARDIKENGLYHPPTVRPVSGSDQQKEGYGGQPWVLVAGGRRYGAMFSLGWMKIPVSVRESMDDLRHRSIELFENTKRKEMTWQEQSFLMQEIVQLRQDIAAQQGKKITHAEIAHDLKINPGTLSRDIKAAEAMQANPGLKQASSRKSALRAAETAKIADLSRDEYKDLAKKKMVQGIAQSIVTANATDYIRTIESKSIDLVLTDPPFGIDYFTQGHKMEEKGLAEFDDSPETMKDLMYDLVPQWFRVLRETGWLMVFMGEEGMPIIRDLVNNCCVVHNDYRWQYDEEDGELSEKEQKRRERYCISCVEDGMPEACRWVTAEPKPWIWYRENSRNRPRYPEIHAMNMYESILVVNMGKARLNYPCTNVIAIDAEYGEERFHPHQKPVALAKELVNRTCMIADSVLDTTYGSGALLAGAAGRAMYVYGSELNPSLRGPAVGLIAKHALPIPTRGKDISYERYRKKMDRVVAGVQDFTEEEIEDGVQEESSSGESAS